MPINQIKIFKIPISQENGFNIEEKSLEVINDFLKDDNLIYINHSMVILTEDARVGSGVHTFCKYLVISMVYKNLKQAGINVSKLSSKTKEKTLATFSKDEKSTSKPNFKTEIDKISNA